jgi:16S rRNA (guanine(966)-N(2))-methyltransferase RsmD
MRIISGEFRGRKFQPPGSFKGRPTTDFAREGLFNILRFRAEMAGVNALDLFSGTGAMTYELLSHGAATVVAVERSAPAVRFIRTTAELLKPEAVQVLQGDVFQMLPRLRGPFEIVIADPPYAEQRLTNLPSMVRNAGLLAKGGVFVLEHGPDIDFEDEPGFDDHRRYGHVHFSFFNFDEE